MKALKKILTPVAGWFSLYFSKPADFNHHSRNISKVSSYAGHILLLVGALTSLPALASLFGSLLAELVPVYIYTPATFFLCAVCLFLVDFTVAAFGPYSFAALARREYWSGGIAVTVTVILAIVSIHFSWTGNAALVDSIYSNDSQLHTELATVTNEKREKLAAETKLHDSQVAAARAADAEKLKEAKARGAAMVATATEAALAKYGDSEKYRSKISEKIQDAKRDSAALVSQFSPTSHIAENRKNTAIGELNANYEERLSLLRKRDEEVRAKHERKVAAVFAITGGLGSAATVLGLLCTVFAMMVVRSKGGAGGKSQAAPEKGGATPAQKLGGFKAELLRKKIDGTDTSVPVASINRCISQIAETDPAAAATKMQEFRRDFPNLF